MIRCAIVFFSDQPKAGMAALVEGLRSGLVQRGFQVDVVDGLRTSDYRLSGHHYIMVGCEVTTWWKGTLMPRVGEFLARAGVVTGKKSFAFVRKGSPLATDKTLANLMRAMEFEGMLLKYSEVLQTGSQAETVVRQLKIE